MVDKSDVGLNGTQTIVDVEGLATNMAGKYMVIGIPASVAILIHSGGAEEA